MLPEILPRHSIVAKLRDLVNAARAAARSAGVLIVRIEGLRRLALGSGYAASDELLSESYRQLQSVARRLDFVGRYGDQDFIYLVSQLSDESQALLCANKLQRALLSLPALNGGSGSLHLMIGGAVFPSDGDEPERLLWLAESALALSEPRAAPISFASGVPVATHHRNWQLERALKQAIERGEIELCYQPKISVADGGLAGVEALARWDSAECGAISAGTFVPLAETTHLIEDLTWGCISTALQQLTEWRRHELHTTVAVNLSPVCLHIEDFHERLRGALSLWNVKPDSLTLEVTESAVMSNPETGFGILRDLRAMGVRVSIDDFGTGHSSFAYFRTLPADELKIDQSFIQTLEASAADRHVVRSIIDLAHRFDFKVVAEGVENAATLEILREMNCDVVQGYYLGRPQSAADILAGRGIRAALLADETATVELKAMG